MNSSFFLLSFLHALFRKENKTKKKIASIQDSRAVKSTILLKSPTLAVLQNIQPRKHAYASGAVGAEPVRQVGHTSYICIFVCMEDWNAPARPMYRCQQGQKKKKTCIYG